jgi:phosphatidylglycerol:prolipoprotein diacylglycerol transferase
MCSELFRIPITVSGVPIFGFGVVLAVWLAIGAWALTATAKVAGWPAALKGHIPTILIVAVIVALFLPRYFPEGVPLRGYGLMVLAGSILGILMAIHRAHQARLAADEIMGVAVVLFISGVVGARLFYIIEYWESRIRRDDWWATLKEALSYTEGGLVVYGAFVGGMLGFAAYVWRRRLPPLALADLIAPSMMAGLALGRIGCLLNGCCYGGESTAPWAVTFPRENAPQHFSAPYADQAAAGRFYGFRLVDDATHGAVVIDRLDAGSPAEKAGLLVGEVVQAVNGNTVATADAARDEIIDTFLAGKSLRLGMAGGEQRTIAAIDAPPRSLPVHPTQIYSAIDAGLLAWLLWAFYPYRRRDGAVIVLMITLHPISRFLLECIRVDESPVFGTGLSISQNLSLALLAVAVVLWVWLLQKPPGRLAFPLPTAKVANQPAG